MRALLIKVSDLGVFGAFGWPLLIGYTVLIVNSRELQFIFRLCDIHCACGVSTGGFSPFNLNLAFLISLSDIMC